MYLEFLSPCGNLPKGQSSGGGEREQARGGRRQEARAWVLAGSHLGLSYLTSQSFLTYKMGALMEVIIGLGSFPWLALTSARSQEQLLGFHWGSASFL